MNSTRPLIREALENAASGRVLSAAVVLVVCAATVLGGVMSGAEHHRHEERQREFRASAGYVVRVEVDDPGQSDAQTELDRLTCERLNLNDAVEAAGSTRFSGEATPVAQPDHRLTLVEASPGFVDVVASLGVDLQQEFPLLISRGLSTELELHSARNLTLTGHRPARVGIAPVEVVAQGFGDAVIAIVPPVATATTCFVAFRPGTQSRDMLVGAFGRGDLLLQPVLLGAQDIESAISRSSAELPMYPPLLGAALGAGLWTVMTWLRRGDRALYKSLGIDTPAIRTMMLVEGSALATVGGLAGVAFSCLVVGVRYGAPFGMTAFWTSISLAVSTIVGVAAVCAVTRNGRLLERLKDR